MTEEEPKAVEESDVQVQEEPIAEEAHSVDEDGMPHVSPIDMYLKVFGALFVLTIITWAVAFIDLGWLSTPVAIGIAMVKAGLVIAFFMHLKDAAKINWIVGLAAIFMVIVMFAFTMSDYVSRSWIPYPDSWM